MPLVRDPRGLRALTGSAPLPCCLQAANVGDSSAFFIDPATGQSRELTEDHRLTNPRERQRLQDMGIQVGGHWP